jgi:hypothetical protein
LASCPQAIWGTTPVLKSRLALVVTLAKTWSFFSLAMLFLTLVIAVGSLLRLEKPLSIPKSLAV